ncbi:MAG TPA: TPM domain-containing protein [Chitinophagales bacterium]|nr:TPM domain-containing protein [Chitinophagales bacterium]
MITRITTSFFFFILLASAAFAQADSANVELLGKQQQLADYRQAFWNNLPQPVGWLNDFANVYTTSEKSALDSLMAELNKDKLAQFAIVTLDSICVSADKFDSLNLRIASAWGVGEKGKNNGILIGINTGHRKIRIDNGDGIVKVISDMETKEIINNFFTPAFKRGEYYEGTLAGLLELNKLLKARMK